MREALLNAIAHRDYRFTDHVQINLFWDRVEFINSGGLVAGLERKDLGRVSRPRNPLLFSMLERMDLVENIGSGIKRMRNGMKEHGCSAPTIELGNTWFSISFPRSNPDPIGEVAGEVTGEVTGEVAILLKALLSPLGRVELQEKLKLKSQSNFRALYLTPALEQGLIERTIPEKPTSRLQKYRLTDQGRQFLKDLGR